MAPSKQKKIIPWIEYEREELEKDGKVEIHRKLRPEKKTFIKAEKLDLILKFVGIVAIFLPLLSIMFQNKNNLENEKKKQLSEIFITITKSLSMNDEIVDIDGCEDKLDSLEINNKTKLIVYGNRKIANDFAGFLDVKRVKLCAKKINRYIIKVDTIINKVNFIFSNYKKIPYQSFFQDSCDLIESIKHSESILNSLSFLNIAYSKLDKNYKLLVSSDSLKYSGILQKIQKVKDYCTKLSLLTESQLPNFLKRSFSSDDLYKINFKIIETLYNDKSYIREKLLPDLELMENNKSEEFSNDVYNHLE